MNALCQRLAQAFHSFARMRTDFEPTVPSFLVDLGECAGLDPLLFGQCVDFVQHEGGGNAVSLGRDQKPVNEPGAGSRGSQRHDEECAIQVGRHHRH